MILTGKTKLVYSILIITLISTMDVYNHIRDELYYIKEKNQEGLVTKEFTDYIQPKGIILEFKNQCNKEKYHAIKDIIYHTKKFFNHKVCLCIIKRHCFNQLVNYIPVFQYSVDYDFCSWEETELFSKGLYIINDIKKIDMFTIDNLLYHYLKENDFKFILFFYDKFTINNCLIIFKKLFSTKKISQLTFYLALKLNCTLCEYFNSFKKMHYKYLPKIDKYFNGITYEIVKENNIFIQKLIAINQSDQFNNYVNECPIKFSIVENDFTSNQNSPYEKGLIFEDTLNGHKLDMKLYNKNNYKINDIIKENCIKYYFDYCIIIKIQKSDIQNEGFTYVIKFLVKDEKIQHKTSTKRHVRFKVVNPYHISMYSYFINRDESFSNTNFLPENIYKTKNFVDYIKRLKINFENILLSFIDLKTAVDNGNTQWTESYFFWTPNLFDIYHTDFISNNYSSVVYNFNSLFKLFCDLPNYRIQKFYFHYNHPPDHDYLRFKKDKILINDWIGHIAIQEKMLQQQKYLNSFGLKLTFNSCVRKKEYFLFIIPSFKIDFEETDIYEIIEVFQARLSLKLCFLEEVLLDKYENYKNYILTHYLMLEMISNFIYLIYLDDKEKTQLIRHIIEQIFLDPKSKTIFNIENPVIKFPSSLQVIILEDIIQQTVMELINELLDAFFNNLRQIHFSIIFQPYKCFLDGDKNKIAIIIDPWKNSINSI